MRELCNVVYALIVQRVEAQVIGERQVAAVLLAAGAKDVDMPSLTGAQADFDALLMEEPSLVEINPERAELRAALGLLQ